MTNSMLDPTICGDDGPITPEQCALWLDAKYRRHGELQDRAAAMWLRKLSASSSAVEPSAEHVHEFKVDYEMDFTADAAETVRNERCACGEARRTVLLPVKSSAAPSSPATTVGKVFSKPDPQGYEAVCVHYERVLKTIADADPLSQRGLLQEVAKEGLGIGEGMHGMFESPLSDGVWVSHPGGVSWSDVRNVTQPLEKSSTVPCGECYNQSACREAGRCLPHNRQHSR